MAANNEILKYEPNIAGNITTGILYAILGLLFSYYIVRHKTNWALCLPIGAFASSLGFFLRLGMHPHDLLLPLFVAQNILIIATPCAFLAFNYMLYGRLVTAIDPQFSSNKSGLRMEKSRYSFIPPRIVGRTFVISDIATFLIQVAAGSMVGNAKNNRSIADIGDKLFLVGVCAQGISYSLFTILLSDTLLRLVAEARKAGRSHPGKSWMGLDQNVAITIGGLYFSSVFIIIRSVYRIIEFVQGHDGYLISNEVFMFVLDAVPLVLAIGVWAIFWPTVLIDRIAAQAQEEAQMHSMEADNAQLSGADSNRQDPRNKSDQGLINA
ncbi:hypothetical protein BGZ96_003577 [Linnemannia gamsii]|uniref:RTA1-domain-containing protein n=1 Tax=Linnemannia gamsii TaxID=64522 RepID=A0ABQ7JJ33_9FUNG|nr:hypothetical protein BGZ96_003577 [Linnemannia gamsii]